MRPGLIFPPNYQPQLDVHEITMERSTNDQGLLYGSVTQKDIAETLLAAGHHQAPRPCAAIRQ